MNFLFSAVNDIFSTLCFLQIAFFLTNEYRSGCFFIDIVRLKIMLVCKYVEGLNADPLLLRVFSVIRKIEKKMFTAKFTSPLISLNTFLSILK